MAEKRLDIVLGVRGGAQAQSQLRSIGDRLKALKKDETVESLDQIGKVLRGAGAVGGIEVVNQGFRKLATTMEEIALSTKRWQDHVADILKDLPLIGGLFALIETPFKVEEARFNRLRNAKSVREALGLKDINVETGAAAQKVRLAGVDFSGMGTAAARAGFEDKRGDIFMEEARLLSKVASGELSDKMFEEWRKSQAILLEAQLKPIKRQEEDAKRRPLIANAIASGRAGLQDLLTRIGIGGANVLEGVAPLLRPRRRPNAQGVPVVPVAQTFEGTASSAIAAEQAAIFEANMAAAERQIEAAERQERAADVARGAAAGFLEAMRNFGEIVGAPKPIG